MNNIILIILFLILLELFLKNIEFLNSIEKIFNNTIFKIIILFFFIYYFDYISPQLLILFVIYYILISDYIYVINSKKFLEKINKM